MDINLEIYDRIEYRNDLIGESLVYIPEACDLLGGITRYRLKKFILNEGLPRPKLISKAGAVPKHAFFSSTLLNWLRDRPEGYWA